MSVTRRSLLASSLAVLACPVSAELPPLVFAAASLKGVMDQISEEVVPMRLAYGGSGAMARQIMQGAPADLFLSANPDWAAYVARAKAPLAQTTLLGNRLVLVHRADMPATDPTHWGPEDRVAMGFVEAVPAGQYGKAALEALGLWDRVRPHVVETDSVAAALALVTTGALHYAVVYATDALASPEVAILQEFEPALHAPITYPVALFSEKGRGAYDALKGARASEIFARAGFEVL